jgi:hypothetical protein
MINRRRKAKAVIRSLHIVYGFVWQSPKGRQRKGKYLEVGKQETSSVL